MVRAACHYDQRHYVWHKLEVMKYLIDDALERREHGGVYLPLQLHDLGATPHGQRGLDGAGLAARGATARRRCALTHLAAALCKYRSVKFLQKALQNINWFVFEFI